MKLSFNFLDLFMWNICGIGIFFLFNRKPLISSTMLNVKMEGRKMIPISRLYLKIKTPDLQSDWVTMGVIVHKSETRKSSAVNTILTNNFVIVFTSLIFFYFHKYKLFSLLFFSVRWSYLQEIEIWTCNLIIILIFGIELLFSSSNRTLTY